MCPQVLRAGFSEKFSGRPLPLAAERQISSLRHRLRPSDGKVRYLDDLLSIDVILTCRVVSQCR